MKLGLFAAWMGSIGLVTWRAYSSQKRAPLPSELAATIVVYGTLSMAGGDAELPAAVFGWGLLLAGFMNFVPGIANLHTPGSTLNQTSGNPATAAAGGTK